MPELFPLHTRFWKGLRARSNPKFRFLSQCLISMCLPLQRPIRIPGLVTLFTCSGVVNLEAGDCEPKTLDVYSTVCKEFQALLIFCLLTRCAVHSPQGNQSLSCNWEVLSEVHTKLTVYLVGLLYSPVFNKLSKMVIKPQAGSLCLLQLLFSCLRYWISWQSVC